MGVGRKEKYYNFIIMDIIKRSDINYVDKEVTFPFPSLILPANYRTYLLRSQPSNGFSLHVTSTYGAQTEEMGEIWDMFRKRLRGLTI